MWFILQTVVLPLLISLISLATQPDSLKEQYRVGSQKDQKIELKQLRELAKDALEYDYEQTNDFLLRWLRECDMDINCADERIRKTKKWRKENRMDTILNETIAEVSSLPHGKTCTMDSFDNAGYPVVICVLRGVDIRKLLLTGQKDRAMRYYLQWIERQVSEARKLNPDKDKLPKPATTIINVQGLNMRQHACASCMMLAHEILRIGSNYYPEALDLAVFINVPQFARTLVDILKKSLSPHYQGVLKIFGSNKEEYSKFLLEVIPANQLPEEYGGTKPN